MCSIAEALGVWRPGMSETDAPARAADHLAKLFDAMGMAGRLRDLEIPEEGLPLIVEDSMKNFNADPKREFLEHREELHQVIKACW
jgi:alcohol dehydrogenase class IV